MAGAARFAQEPLGNGHGQVIITYDPNPRQWGLPGDKLVPVDYDGDGKVDIDL